MDGWREIDWAEEDRAYQAWARPQMLAKKKCGLLAKPGAGKTRIVCSALHEEQIFHKGLVLIVCTGNAVRTWLIQLQQWLPYINKEDIHLVAGKSSVRSDIWAHAADSDTGICICNWNVFLRDASVNEKISWTAIVGDEYHKFIRRKSTKTFKHLRRLVKDTSICYLLTGTWFRKDPSSTWTLFNLTRPDIFGSEWKFKSTFCMMIDNGFGTEVIGSKNVEQYRNLLDRHQVYIPDKTLQEALPEGKRQLTHIDMTPIQEKLYTQLENDMLAELDSGKVLVVPTVLSRLIQFRKLLCHPALVDPAIATAAGHGGAVEYLMEYAEDPDRHFIIFTVFRDAHEYIERALNSVGRKDIFKLRGQISLEEQGSQIRGFAEQRGIMICTIAYAESFDLETCDTSFFNGYDFSMDINEQAEGRTQRMISKHAFVQWNYFKYANTIDDNFLLTLDRDLFNYKQVATRPEQLIRLLRGPNV